MESDTVGDAEIRRRIIRLVWPATVEALLQMMLGIVGMGMVGSLGATAIGGVGLANRVSQSVWSLFAAGERYVAELMRWVVILTCGTSAALFILARPIMRPLTPDLMVVALGARRYLTGRWKEAAPVRRVNPGPS